MPVPSSIADLSQTAASNSPAGSESPSTLDDYTRTHASFIARLRDGAGYTAEATVASAATADIGAATSFFVQITGTTTITSFGTAYNGARFLRFAGSLTLTHNATTLILPGGANITTAAGDTAVVVPSGNPAAGWRVMTYVRAATSPDSPSFTNLTYTGTLTGSTGVLNIGSGQFYKAADGKVTVGATTGGGQFNVYGSGTTAASNALITYDSAGTTMFFQRDDGAVNLGQKASSPYNLTTATAANATLLSDGFLYRSTSSIKYKSNVQDAPFGLAHLMALRPVTYKGNGTADGDRVFGGLIAEEVHAAGLPEFVQYADDGSPDALAYGNMVALCIKAIQEQQAQIAALTSRISTLEAA